MASELKKSDLLKIIEHGDENQKENALKVILSILKNEGDFLTVSKLMPEIKKLDTFGIMNTTSLNFFKTLNYDDAKGSLISLENYLRDENTTNKEKALSKLPLYAMINLYNRFVGRNSTELSFHHAQLDEIKIMYTLIDIVDLIKRDKFIGTYKNCPEELRSATAVYTYVQRELNGKGNSNSSKEVNTLKNAKLKYANMRNCLISAEDGEVEDLEETLQENDLMPNNPNSAESKVIKALLPYAALMRFTNELNEKFHEYEPASDFEKNSKVYSIAAKYIPVFFFEKIRQKISAGLDEAEATHLFNEAKKDNLIDIIKPFAMDVQRLYINKLCEQNHIGGV
jgi:hypothetical protein